MATAALISMVTSWIIVGGALVATFLVRRLRAPWIRWLLLGLVLGNSGGLMDWFARNRDWPWHQQLVVSSITLALSAVGLALVILAALTYPRRHARTSVDA
jgi:hypothetical protein